jgi:hypothetical protein
MLRTSLGKGRAKRWIKIHDKTGETYMDWGGAPIFLRTAVAAAIDGLDVGWGVGDELRYWPQDAYETFLGRVRVPCPLPQSAFTSTPTMGYMADEFNSGKKDRELITVPTLANAHNLAPDYVENLRLSYSRRLQKAVLEGFFTILEGAVYEALDVDIWNSAHCIEYTHSKRKRTYLAVDPGRRSSWIFVQERAPLDWVVFDELILDDISDSGAVAKVNARAKSQGYAIDEIWTDPAADATQSAFNLDTIAMLRGIKTRGNAGIRYITGPYRSIAFGVDKMRTLFGDPEIGQPIRLRFARGLRTYEQNRQRGVVKDHLGYHYPDHKIGRPYAIDPVKDGITDHSCDALRYWGVGMWVSTNLRALDKEMREEAQRNPGYKIAA